MNLLTASIFSAFPEVVFGFSTRNGGVSPEPYGLNMSFNVGDDPRNVEKNLELFLNKLGVHPHRLAIPRQVHSDTVKSVSKPGIYDNCDALMTTEKNVFLRVTVADCLPVFFYDPGSHTVAAVHAGWRGCLNRIVEKTLKEMIGKFSADPTAIRVYIGPSARSCCYEVGDEVAVQFDSRFLIPKTHTHSHLDMLGFTLAFLDDAGIQQSHIEASPFCTICTPNLFHSYRRDGARSGRMMGVIGLKTY